MDKQFMESMLQRTFIDNMSTDEFLKSPFIVARSEGVYLWDTEGKQYWDAIGGIFVASLGHKHPRLVDTMKKQVEILTLAPPLHSVGDICLEFIEKLGNMTPGNLKFVKTYSGGSESIESAIKYVRQYYQMVGKPQKFKVLSNYLSYHGATLGALAAGDAAAKPKFGQQAPGFEKCYHPKQLRDLFPTWEETCRHAAQLVRMKIEAEHPETVAAFLVEPICNTAGIVAPTEEYYQIIRKACDDYDVKLIFDEVLTGIGKTGDLFAAQTYGITPDIICSGKGLSSGMLPMGSMIADLDMDEAFRGAPERHFGHGHTYANFPLACAVGKEVLTIIDEENLTARARVIGAMLRSRLEKLSEETGIIREIRGRGLLLGVEVEEDPVAHKPFPNKCFGGFLKQTARDNGLVMRIGPDWFAVAPPLISTDAEIDDLCGRIEKSVRDALALYAHRAK